MTDPPLLPEAVNVIVADVELSAVATPIVGADGTVAAAEAEDMVTVAVPVVPFPAVAVTVNVSVENADEVVPLMDPVLELKFKPEGKLGLIDQDVAVSPEFVGVKVVIATPTTAFIVEGE